MFVIVANDYVFHIKFVVHPNQYIAQFFDSFINVESNDHVLVYKACQKKMILTSLEI